MWAWFLRGVEEDVVCIDNARTAATAPAGKGRNDDGLSIVPASVASSRRMRSGRDEARDVFMLLRDAELNHTVGVLGILLARV